jgi:hypothetical protein
VGRAAPTLDTDGVPWRATAERISWTMPWHDSVSLRYSCVEMTCDRFAATYARHTYKREEYVWMRCGDSVYSCVKPHYMVSS